MHISYDMDLMYISCDVKRRASIGIKMVQAY